MPHNNNSHLLRDAPSYVELVHPPRPLLFRERFLQPQVQRDEALII